MRWNRSFLLLHKNVLDRQRRRTRAQLTSRIVNWVERTTIDADDKPASVDSPPSSSNSSFTLKLRPPETSQPRCHPEWGQTSATSHTSIK
jgi:hypothetical protein